MTKQITIKSCYIWILLWIVISTLPFLAWNNDIRVLNSYDENGCRESLHSSERYCHKDGNVELSSPGTKQETGEPNYGISGLSTKSQIESMWVWWIALFVLIQIIALMCWNMHYNWISVNIKSCWDNEQ